MFVAPTGRVLPPEDAMHKCYLVPRNLRHPEQCPVLGRGHCHLALEQAAQVALIRKPGGERNLTERQVSSSQRLAGEIDALLADVHANGAVIEPVKSFSQMSRMNTNRPCYLSQRYRLRERVI